MTSPGEGTWVGKVLGGKYRIEERLGAGGMGEVYCATHMELQETRAIKCLHADAAKDAETVARFLREARACARLKSQHALKVYDVGSADDGSPFMVMELLHGQNLGDVIKELGTLSMERTATLILQALEAIAEAHARGIVHRDLKPANLFVTQDIGGDARVKVVDFGISKIQQEVEGALTDTFTVIGSPFYMSPEQMRTLRDVDARTDIWAIGVILYRLLTGVVPFQGNSVVAVCSSVMQDEPKLPTEFSNTVPEDVAAMIMACLVKDRSQRVQQISVIAKVLARYAPEQGQRSLKRIAAVSAGYLSPRDSIPEIVSSDTPSIPGLLSEDTTTTAGLGRLIKRVAEPTRSQVGLYAIIGIAVVVALTVAFGAFTSSSEKQQTNAFKAAGSSQASARTASVSSAAATDSQPLHPQGPTSSTATVAAASASATAKSISSAEVLPNPSSTGAAVTRRPSPKTSPPEKRPDEKVPPPSSPSSKKKPIDWGF